MINKEKCKVISDFTLATLLVMNNFKVVKIEKDFKNHKYKNFYFLETPELNEFIQDYYTDNLDEKNQYAKRVIMKYVELKKIKYEGGER
jgi:hypothetical protein